VAAFLLSEGKAAQECEVIVRTGAGLKHLTLIEREGDQFLFEMNMGRARIAPGHLEYELETHDVTILDVGNPQCAVFVSEFPDNWRALGADLESHPMFVQRTNVSFIQVLDEHTIDVRFWERGAGETMSSGTGSMGAAAAARARGLVREPVTVLTPAGPLLLDWRGDDVVLTGPAEIVARGEYYAPRP
jgi:diaminopimelate epimerase